MQALEDAADDADDVVSVPRWAVEGAAELFVATSHQIPSKHGRKSPRHKCRRYFVAEWRRDQIDWRRYQEVYYRRLARRDDSAEHPRSPKELRRQRREYERIVRDRAVAHGETVNGVVDPFTPYPWITTEKDGPDPDVFSAVALMFAGSSLYRGTHAEIKNSWDRVGQALARGESWRYYPSRWLMYGEGQLLTSDAYRVR